MKCPKCNYHWSLAGANEPAYRFCPSCQSKVVDSPEYFDSVQDGICYVVKMCGNKPYEILYDNKRLKACLTDVLGTNYPNRKLIELLIEKRICRILYSANEQNDDAKKEAIRTANELLVKKTHLQPEKASALIGYFTIALDWKTQGALKAMKKQETKQPFPDGPNISVMIACVAIGAAAIIFVGGIGLYNNSRKSKLRNESSLEVIESAADESTIATTEEHAEQITTEGVTESDNDMIEETEPLLLQYEIRKGYAVIIGLQEEQTKITIPETIEDVPVKRIESYAFSGCETLQTVVLPEKLTMIGEGAFADCKCLMKIDFPNSIRYIGKNAFQNCLNLQVVELPWDLQLISPGLFLGCKNLEYVKLSYDTHIIGQGAFEGCEGLKDIQIPQAWYIGESAFKDCTALKSITFPKYGNVNFVEKDAFAGCNSLNTIYGRKGKLEEKLSSEMGVSFIDTSTDEDIDYYAMQTEKQDGYVKIRSQNFENIVVCGDTVLLCPIPGINMPEAFYFDCDSLGTDDWDRMVWQSSDPSIATVNDSLLTAIKPGNVRISCTYTDRDGNKHLCESKFTIVAEETDSELLSEIPEIEVNENTISCEIDDSFGFESQYGELGTSLSFEFPDYHEENVEVALYTEAGIPVECFGGHGEIHLIAPCLDANWKYLKRSGYLTIVAYTAEYNDIDGSRENLNVLATKKIPLQIDLI